MVVSGTYGKTTLTAALIHILKNSNIDISYMVGGFFEGLDETIIHRSDKTQWSVIEGDEYISDRDDPKSKFFYYHPDILILNPIEWDHTDVFKTKQDYLDNFKKLVKSIPSSGIIYSVDYPNNLEILEDVDNKVIFKISEYSENKNVIGKFNRENLEFVRNILLDLIKKSRLNIAEDIVQKYLNDFPGVKRRMEIRLRKEDLIIIDDFGSSPAKAVGSLESVLKEFPEYKVIAVFEPNEGSRTRESMPLYDKVFNNVDLVVLPRFRNIKSRLTEDQHMEYMKNKHNNLVTAENSSSYIKNYIEQKPSKYCVIFLGSHSFENDIQSLIQAIQ